MKVHQIPIFTDNYVWLIENQGEAHIVDPGEAPTVLSYLKSHNLNLVSILVTHEHSDHIGGVEELKKQFPNSTIYWNKNLKDQDIIHFSDEQIEVWNTPGHMKNHVSFYLKKNNWLFCGDTLFSLGCGRILEGEFNQGCQALFESLQKIKSQTNPETKVFCTHEYTLKNMAFTQSLEVKYHLPQNLTQELNNRFNLTGSTLPSTMEFEKNFNPFLIAKNIYEFSQLRMLRNNF